eukprot:2199164-Prorocentrum_lima.AAC.1
MAGMMAEMKVRMMACLLAASLVEMTAEMKVKMMACLLAASLEEMTRHHLLLHQFHNSMA